MFDVVGLWLLYGTGEHRAVSHKACGSFLSLACVRAHESDFDRTGIYCPATRKCEIQGPRRNTLVDAQGWRQVVPRV